METIIGKDVISKVNVDPAQQTISTGPNAGQPYYRARFDGKGFIVTEQFFKDWTAGNIAEVNLTESSYQVEDPMTPGQMINRESWQMSAYATYDQLVRIKTNENKLSRLDKQNAIELKALEINGIKELGLDEATMKALLAEI